MSILKVAQVTTTATVTETVLTIVLAVVRDLCPSSPDDLSTCCDKTQFTDVDFNDRSLGQNAQLRVHGVLWVLLDADNW